MVKVLYIGGAGRSGSTLLEMILGNIPGFFSIGEIRYFWEYLVQGDIVCGCGARLDECAVWGAVTAHLDSAHEIDINRMAALSRRLNRTRNLPRLTFNSLRGASAEWQELARGNDALYQAIACIADDQTLVDTSKVPSQLLLLRQIPGIDLRLLHLVRDGRAVAYSWSKRHKLEPGVVSGQARMPRRPALRSMITWAVENIFILKMRHTIPYTVMRYEDFTQDPQGELKSALMALGFDNVDLNLLVEPLVFHPTHSVGGNPIRFSRSQTSIVADNEWCENMSSITKISLGLMAMPVLAYFKYKLGSNPHA